MSTTGQRGAGDRETEGKLSIVGVQPQEEELYRELLRAPGSTLAELARRARVGAAQARQVVDRLEQSGLLSRRPGTPVRYMPAPPDVAVGALIAQRQDELNRAKLVAEGLLADFHQGKRYEHTSQVLEIISGREAIHQRAVQLMRSAKQEVMIFDKPPYITPQDNPDEFDGLARRVHWRAVYSTDSLAEPGQLDRIQLFRSAGEQARLSPLVPIKLAVTDRRLALLPLTMDGPRREETAILVHPSSMLSMLTMYFDIVWERAIPLDAHPDEKAQSESDSHPDQQILQLLASGRKDEAIARQLGVSLRTARRWIAHLMADHGVTTRFQLGLVVARELGLEQHPERRPAAPTSPAEPSSALSQ
jgi:sugar-specific transcriptional regulator TrmB